MSKPHATRLCVALLLCVAMMASEALAAEQFFDVIALPNSGRSVAAQLADFDGDGRLDLFVGVLTGLPPDDRRIARVYLQAEDGTFPTTPSHVKELPGWTAVYDIEDVRPDSPGVELIALVPDGVSIVSLASASAPTWDLKVPGATTLGPAADERGLEPFRIVHRHLGAEPWLLVPQIGELTAVTGTGEVKATLSQPRRANYFILPATGLLALESDYQIFLDAPKLLLGDIDGDGRNDMASATRHEIWTFLQRPDGTFAHEPDQKLSLGLVTPRDHIRGSGGVATAAGDIDGDGKLDLLVSHVSGGFTDATTTVRVHLNKGSGWKLDAPDQVMTMTGSVSSNALFDMNRDGKVELLRLQAKFGLLDLIEMLVSRDLDLEFSIYRHEGKSGFSERAWVDRKISLPISFETFRTRGFVPTARVDLNGDGYLDFTSSGAGEELEFYAGSARGPFRSKPAKQRMSTAGMIEFGDFSGDGLLDFVIFDPHNYDVPIQLGRNLGTLPGTPAAVRAAD